MIPTIIEVAISLIVIYFLMSTLVSFINEIIALIFSFRGKLLYKGIGELLGDTGLHEHLYSSLNIHKLRIFGIMKKTNYKPSNIHAENFSDAFLEKVLNSPTTVSELKQNIEGLNNNFLQKLMLQKYNELIAKGISIESFKESIKSWYDNYMNVISEVYKLKMKVVSFVVSITLCLFMNIDTLELTKFFWENKASREQLNNFANELTANYAKVDTINLDKKQQLQANIKSSKMIIADINQFNLPIYWDFKAICKSFDDTACHCILKFITKIFGIMITACCLTLGAPFWFQLMKQLVDYKKEKTIKQ